MAVAGGSSHPPRKSVIWKVPTGQGRGGDPGCSGSPGGQLLPDTLQMVSGGRHELTRAPPLSPHLVPLTSSLLEMEQSKSAALRTVGLPKASFDSAPRLSVSTWLLQSREHKG